MNRLLFVLLLLAASLVVVRAAPVDLTLRLPAGVQRLRNGYDENDPSHYTITLNAAARDLPILLPPGASFDAEKCVIQLRVAADAQVSFGTAASPEARITLEVAKGAGASSVDTNPASPPPSQPGGGQPSGSGIAPPTAPADSVVNNAPAHGSSGQTGQPQNKSNVDPIWIKEITTALFPDATASNFDPAAKADFSVPASAAATVVGASSTLVRPGTPREVVTSLLSDFDKDGKLQSGFSLAFTPYTLFRSGPVTADAYNNDATTRFLTRMQVSLAGKEDAAIVTAGSKAVRLGVGLTAVLFDDGDLRLNNSLLRSIVQKLHKGISGSDILAYDGAKEPFTDDDLKGARKLWDAAKAENWNAGSAGLGVAPAFLSITGKLADAKSDGVMVWASYSGRPPAGSPEHQTIQWIFGGNARFNQRVQTSDIWGRNDSLNFGGQLRYGGEAGNFFAEGQYRRRTSATAATTEKFVYELGLERRLSEGLWLNLSWTNDDAVKGGQTIRSGVRYGFGDKAVLQAPSQ